jgi:hypothetical protein
MIRMIKGRLCILIPLFLVVLISSAQTQSRREEMSIQGYSGRATVMRSQGRSFVDVQDLARITKGSLSFEGNQIILTLSPGGTSAPAADTAGESGFSSAFRRAGIEAMASIREWGGMLKVIVEAGDSVALASAAASTADDHRGLELIRNEFNNLQVWADNYVEARDSLNAAELSTSENPLKNDEGAQKIIQCGQFLAQMFASSTFQDEVACR